MIPYPSLTLLQTGKKKSWPDDSADGPLWGYPYGHFLGHGGQEKNI